MEEPTSKAIMARMQCGVVGEEGSTTINCAMYYCDKNPYEVVFMSTQATEDDEPVEWHYARELLNMAITNPEGDHYGDGDVTLYSEGPLLFQIFTAQDQKVLLAFAKDDMGFFLNATYELVPFGSETINFDDELSKLLDSENDS